MAAKKVKPAVELKGASQPLDAEGVLLLNAEVKERHEWYSLFGGKAPAKQADTGKYTDDQQRQSGRHEASKRALVVYVGGDDFRHTCKLIGYRPEMRRGRTLA